MNLLNVKTFQKLQIFWNSSFECDVTRSMNLLAAKITRPILLRSSHEIKSNQIRSNTKCCLHTSLTSWSCVHSDAGTNISINLVSTSTSIQAGITGALVDIFVKVEQLMMIYLAHFSTKCKKFNLVPLLTCSTVKASVSSKTGTYISIHLVIANSSV